MPDKETKEGFCGKTVVLDTRSSWVYIGTMKEEDELFFTLESADAFDISETSLSKHEYLIMAKKDGVAPNRKAVKILKSEVVAVALLQDIMDK